MSPQANDRPRRPSIHHTPASWRWSRKVGVGSTTTTSAAPTTA